MTRFTFTLCCCDTQLALFPVATCLPFIISSKVQIIAGSNIVTVRNKESYVWQRHNFKSKTLSPKPVLSIRAVSRPKQLATGQCLAVYLCLTLLLIFVISLKIRKRSNKRDICAHQTSHSLVVETKAHFRSFKRVYLSHARWKLIEGSWNACDISSKKPA